MKTLILTTSTNPPQPLGAATYLVLNSSIQTQIANKYIGNGPVKVVSMEGYCGGNTGTFYYLQIVALTVAGTPMSPPLYSVGISGGSPFSFIYPAGLDTSTSNALLSVTTIGDNTYPVAVAISSTSQTYTSTATPVDVQVGIEYNEDLPVNGILVTGVNVGGIVVYSDPNPANRIVNFVAQNNTGAIGYIMMFAYVNPPNGALPIQQWTVPIGATISFFFGNTGFQVQQSSPDYVYHTGCYLLGSSTTQYLTAAANGWAFSSVHV